MRIQLTLFSISLLYFSCSSEKQEKETQLPSPEEEQTITRTLPERKETDPKALYYNSLPDSAKLKITLSEKDSVFVNGLRTELENLQEVIFKFLNKNIDRHFICMYTKNKTSYSLFIKVSDHIKGAYTTLKNTESGKLFHKEYKQLKEEEKIIIDSLVPEHVMQYEPN